MSAKSPCEKNVSFGSSSTILRPSPAFARKVPESKVLLVSLLFKMFPVLNGLPVLWINAQGTATQIDIDP